MIKEINISGDSLVMKVVHDIEETEEEFVFKTMEPFCSSVAERRVKKDELRRALRLYYHMGDISANEYQTLSARTISPKLTQSGLINHALHGIVGEVGEIHSLYQKMYQGHALDAVHLKKEVGDLLWFVTELCTAYDWTLSDIMKLNIDKLRARYPDGFEAERSLNRKEGDV